jgi:HlyD family secretion protein
VNFLRPEENLLQNRLIEPIPEQLHVVEINEFLPQINQWVNICGVTLLIIFGVGMGLTTVLHYKVTVKAPASIRPVGELRVVQSAMTGIVQRILVKDDQMVSQGDAIVYIDNSHLQTQKNQLQNSLQQSKLQLVQIDAQLHEINTQILSQTDLNYRTVVAAQAELKANQRNYSDQKMKADAEMNAAESSFWLAKVQIERLRREKVLATNLQEAESALNLAKLQRDRLRIGFLTGAISRNMYEEKEQEVMSAIAKFEQAKFDGKNLLDEKQQALELAQANLQKTRTEINPSDASVTVAYEHIKQEYAKGKGNLAALNKERQTLLQQRLETEKQMVRTRQELNQIETDLHRSIIRAPITGTILQLGLRNPGQVVQSSEAIAQIAPQNADLLIKAYVPAKDINKVRAGEKVQIRISACPYPEYGTLKGDVQIVSPDALPMNKKESTMSAYEVQIKPKTLFVGRGDHKCYLQSGMEGQADIISQEETLLEFILRKARLMSDI